MSSDCERVNADLSTGYRRAPISRSNTSQWVRCAPPPPCIATRPRRDPPHTLLVICLMSGLVGWRASWGVRKAEAVRKKSSASCRVVCARVVYEGEKKERGKRLGLGETTGTRRDAKRVETTPAVVSPLVEAVLSLEAWSLDAGKDPQRQRCRGSSAADGSAVLPVEGSIGLQRCSSQAPDALETTERRLLLGEELVTWEQMAAPAAPALAGLRVLRHHELGLCLVPSLSLSFSCRLSLLGPCVLLIRGAYMLCYLSAFAECGGVTAAAAVLVAKCLDPCMHPQRTCWHPERRCSRQASKLRVGR